MVYLQQRNPNYTFNFNALKLLTMREVCFKFSTPFKGLQQPPEKKHLEEKVQSDMTSKKISL